MSPKNAWNSLLAENDQLELGAEAAKHIAFEAIHDLWAKRQAEGLTKTEIARLLNKRLSWVSRSFAGPGNWTLETLGGIVEALDGVLRIQVLPSEDVRQGNFNFYAQHLDAYAPKPKSEYRAISPSLVGQLKLAPNSGAVSTTTQNELANV